MAVTFHRCERNRKGFTLLEVLVAFSLLSIMLLVIIQSQSESILFVKKTAKLELAQSVVFDELLAAERNFPSSTALNESGTFPDDHVMAGESWEKKIETISLMGLIKLRKLTFRVIWKTGLGGEGSFESSIFAGT